jgi:hypothetical protein
MSIEKRRFVRVRPSGLVAKRATIVIDARLPAVDCSVIDLSAGGACVFVNGSTPIPRKGQRLGLQF